MTERELIEQYRKAKANKVAADEALEYAKDGLARAEAALIEHLENLNASATAHYEGIGHISVNKPRLYASCTQDNMPKLLEYLNSIGRDDLIKTTVMPQTLSSFCAEKLEAGEAVPEFISQYFKPVLKLNE